MKWRACTRVLLAFAVALAMAITASNAAAAESSTVEKIKAIREDYRQQQRAAVEALQSARTREEGLKLYHQKQPNAAQTRDRLMSLARFDPKSADGFEALLAAAEFSSIAWDGKDELVRRNEVIQLLRDNHIANPRLGEAFRWLMYFDMESARVLMREAAQRNPNRDARGMAIFFLASDLETHASLNETLRELPSFRANLEQHYGKDQVADWAKGDPKVLQGQAIELLVQAQSEYGDVKIDDQPISEQSEHILFRLRHLQIGQPAPDIVGTDQNGQPMRLSDYRGKVVAIVFWGSWCGVCMHRVPDERELVKQMEGKPFVLLGVNSDPKDRVNAIIKENQINWRSWADGPLDGAQPIARTWNVRSWPQIYVLDRAGVIRYTEQAFGATDDLKRKIDGLLSQASGEDAQKP